MQGNAQALDVQGMCDTCRHPGLDVQGVCDTCRHPGIDVQGVCDTRRHPGHPASQHVEHFCWPLPTVIGITVLILSENFKKLPYPQA